MVPSPGMGGGTTRVRDNLVMTEKQKLIGIYAIKQISTGVVYIGRSVNIDNRWRRHKSDLNCSRHHCLWLQRTWLKYGESDFEFTILEIIENKGDLRKKEAKWMNRYLNIFNGIQLSDKQGVLAHSKETKEKMSASQLKRFKNNPMKPLSEKQKKQISLVHKGKVVSKETRKKQSISAKARCTPEIMSAMAIIGNAKRKYTSLSDDHKEKLSVAHKGKTFTKEHCDKIRKGLLNHYANK